MTFTYAANGGDVRLTETLNRDVMVLLGDYVDLIGAGLVTNLGDAGGSGSTTHKVPQVDWDNAMTAPIENNALGATALTTGNATVAVARQALRRDVTDLMAGTGGAGMLNWQGVAQGMAAAAILRRTDMVATLFGALSNTVGTSGVNMDVDDWYDAIAQLELSNMFGGYASVLYPQQYIDLRNAIRGEGGAHQYITATQEQLTAKGSNFKGSFAGVPIWTSDSVPTANAGADSAGAMFGDMCFGYREMSVGSLAGIPGFDPRLVDPSSPIWVAFERDEDVGRTLVVGNYYFGVSELEDARGVGIVTDR